MQSFRSGAIGALADEFERAAAEYVALVESISDEEYERILDETATDEDFRSARSITRHVIAAGYGHAGYVRQALGLEARRPEVQPPRRAEVRRELERVCGYLADTVEGRWGMTEEEIVALRFVTRWGVDYDVEQMLEHAIVHVLRHRRQIARLLGRPDLYAA